jgi:hypothetical protein
MLFPRHARRVAAARAPVRSLMRDEQTAVKLELRFAEEMTLQCVPLPIGRRFFCPIVKCCTHMTFGFACAESLKTHVALAHGTSLGEITDICIFHVLCCELDAFFRGLRSAAWLGSCGAASQPRQSDQSRSRSLYPCPSHARPKPCFCPRICDGCHHA